MNMNIIMTIDISDHDILEVFTQQSHIFFSQIQNKMEQLQKNIDQIRIKVILFNQSYKNSDDIKLSKFFILPTDNEDFVEFLEQQLANMKNILNQKSLIKKKKSRLSNGLEALAYAINDLKSNIDIHAEKNVIVVLTNQPAYLLEEIIEYRKNKNQPQSIWMPKSLNEISTTWSQYIDQRTTNLIIFAPDQYPWSLISENWVSTIHYSGFTNSNALHITNFLIDTIANSI